MVYRGSTLIASGIPGHDGRAVDGVEYMTREKFMTITPDRNKFYYVIEQLAPVAPEILGAIEKGAEAGTKFTVAYLPRGTSAVKQLVCHDADAPNWPNIGDALPDDTAAFTSGADIAADADDTLTLYAVDADGKILGAWQKALGADDIKSGGS